MPFARPTAVLDLDLVHDSDLGVQAFARHVGELLPVERARLVVAGMRGALEGRAELLAEAAAGLGDPDLSDAWTGPDVVTALAVAAGAAPAAVEAARAAADQDLARSAWTVGPAEGVHDLRRVLSAHGLTLAVLAAGPVGVPEILDAVEMADLPWIVVADRHRDDWWAEAVRGVGHTGSPRPADHLVVAASPVDLRVPAALGVATALVDRFGRADVPRAGVDPAAPGGRLPGRWPVAPVGTVRTLSGLLPVITAWLEAR